MAKLKSASDEESEEKRQSEESPRCPSNRSLISGLFARSRFATSGGGASSTSTSGSFSSILTSSSAVSRARDSFRSGKSRALGRIGDDNTYNRYYQQRPKTSQPEFTLRLSPATRQRLHRQQSNQQLHEQLVQKLQQLQLPELGREAQRQDWMEDMTSLPSTPSKYPTLFRRGILEKTSTASTTTTVEEEDEEEAEADDFECGWTYDMESEEEESEEAESKEEDGEEEDSEEKNAAEGAEEERAETRDKGNGKDEDKKEKEEEITKTKEKEILKEKEEKEQRTKEGKQSEEKPDKVDPWKLEDKTLHIKESLKMANGIKEVKTKRNEEEENKEITMQMTTVWGQGGPNGATRDLGVDEGFYIEKKRSDNYSMDTEEEILFLDDDSKKPERKKEKKENYGITSQEFVIFSTESDQQVIDSIESSSKELERNEKYQKNKPSGDRKAKETEKEAETIPGKMAIGTDEGFYIEKKKKPRKALAYSMDTEEEVLFFEEGPEYTGHEEDQQWLESLPPLLKDDNPPTRRINMIDEEGAAKKKRSSSFSKKGRERAASYSGSKDGVYIEKKKVYGYSMDTEEEVLYLETDDDNDEDLCNEDDVQDFRAIRSNGAQASSTTSITTIIAAPSSSARPRRQAAPLKLVFKDDAFADLNNSNNNVDNMQNLNVAVANGTRIVSGLRERAAVDFELSPASAPAGYDQDKPFFTYEEQMERRYSTFSRSENIATSGTTLLGNLQVPAMKRSQLKAPAKVQEDPQITLPVSQAKFSKKPTSNPALGSALAQNRLQAIQTPSVSPGLLPPPPSALRTPPLSESPISRRRPSRGDQPTKTLNLTHDTVESRCQAENNIHGDIDTASDMKTSEQGPPPDHEKISLRRPNLDLEQGARYPLTLQWPWPQQHSFWERGLTYNEGLQVAPSPLMMFVPSLPAPPQPQAETYPTPTQPVAPFSEKLKTQQGKKTQKQKSKEDTEKKTWMKSFQRTPDQTSATGAKTLPHFPLTAGFFLSPTSVAAASAVTAAAVATAAATPQVPQTLIGPLVANANKIKSGVFGATNREEGVTCRKKEPVPAKKAQFSHKTAVEREQRLGYSVSTLDTKTTTTKCSTGDAIQSNQVRRNLTPESLDANTQGTGTSFTLPTPHVHVYPHSHLYFHPYGTLSTVASFSPRALPTIQTTALSSAAPLSQHISESPSSTTAGTIGENVPTTKTTPSSSFLSATTPNIPTWPDVTTTAPTTTITTPATRADAPVLASSLDVNHRNQHIAAGRGGGDGGGGYTDFRSTGAPTGSSNTNSRGCIVSEAKTTVTIKRCDAYAGVTYSRGTSSSSSSRGSNRSNVDKAGQNDGSQYQRTGEVSIKTQLQQSAPSFINGGVRTNICFNSASKGTGSVCVDRSTLRDLGNRYGSSYSNTGDRAESDEERGVSREGYTVTVKGDGEQGGEQKRQNQAVVIETCSQPHIKAQRNDNNGNNNKNSDINNRSGGSSSSTSTDNIGSASNGKKDDEPGDRENRLSRPLPVSLKKPDVKEGDWDPDRGAKSRIGSDACFTLRDNAVGAASRGSTQIEATSNAAKFEPRRTQAQISRPPPPPPPPPPPSQAWRFLKKTERVDKDKESLAHTRTSKEIRLGVQTAVTPGVISATRTLELKENLRDEGDEFKDDSNVDIEKDTPVGWTTYQKQLLQDYSFLFQRELNTQENQELNAYNKYPYPFYINPYQALLQSPYFYPLYPDQVCLCHCGHHHQHHSQADERSRQRVEQVQSHSKFESRLSKQEINNDHEIEALSGLSTAAAGPGLNTEPCSTYLAAAAAATADTTGPDLFSPVAPISTIVAPTFPSLTTALHPTSVASSASGPGPVTGPSCLSPSVSGFVPIRSGAGGFPRGQAITQEGAGLEAGVRLTEENGGSRELRIPRRGGGAGGYTAVSTGESTTMSTGRRSLRRSRAVTPPLNFHNRRDRSFGFLSFRLGGGQKNFR